MLLSIIITKYKATHMKNNEINKKYSFFKTKNKFISKNNSIFSQFFTFC